MRSTGRWASSSTEPTGKNEAIMGTIETELGIDLSAFWMPFSANRQFKQAPRLLVGAKDMHYTAHDGRQVLDGTAGLWCVNAGHGREKIINAVKAQLDQLDFAPTFQMGHPKAFEAAQKIAALAPPGFGHVFFTNSGSEAVDSALKIALAYHRARGEGQRTVLIRRKNGLQHRRTAGRGADGDDLHLRLDLRAMGFRRTRKLRPAVAPVAAAFPSAA